VFLLLYWFFSKREKPITSFVKKNKEETISKNIEPFEENKEIFVDDKGKKYWKETNAIQIPRKTYIKGNINGKYRGELIELEEEIHNSTIYDFEVYEAEVTCQEFRERIPFKSKGILFPKDKLPEILQVSLLQNDKWYGLNVLEPKLFNFLSIKKLHQIEGAEIFGTFTAEITGYILDYKTEYEEVIVYVPDVIKEIKVENAVDKKLVSNGVETGKIERKGDYLRKQYYTTNYSDTIWGNWQYSRLINNNSYSEGCFSTILGGLGLILGLLFLIAIFPSLLYFAGFFLMIFLIGYLAPYFKWIFRFLGILLLIIFIGSLVKTCSSSSHRSIPTPLVVDTPRELNPVIEPILDTTTTSSIDTIQKPIRDSIITRFRSWKDYSGKNYEGKYQIRLSDFNKAHIHKNSLNINQNSINSYDKVVFNLKEFDKKNFNSVYNLFDSIGKANQLNKIKFAEMIVTFVQDIPYAIVLDGGCDASLYNDRFTRNYLLNHSGECDGYQQFGINTPVEFLTNLKGDCDTRTLLLYTIFSHYNYDVALMSSEFYGHSIIGINLPINGIAYIYNNQRYVLWESTAPNCKPGIMPNELSNLNNWRISLKSK
jgi:hypothetical protein